MTLVKNFAKLLPVIIACTLGACSQNESINAKQFDQIVEDFKVPAEDNSLWCYWY